jgi:hypothetical protein
VEIAAASAESGTADFYAWGDATTNSLAAGNAQAAPITVPTFALDDYFADKTLPQVVKIDIEGSELAALRGAQRILASDAFILCELHPYAWADAGHSVDHLRALLRQYRRYTVDIATGKEIEEYRYGAVLLRRR